ncbi:sigma-70 family RNA polymerase sigma factor [Sorangium sp. So ce315]|uniref:RNA polymerase sigma factor n=1 Tax=Sorangium sp. So ce315 TaxID=3133299 RepID=UPI003F63001F
MTRTSPAPALPFAGSVFDPYPPVQEVRAPLEFDTVYDGHADFVWRNLRRLGVREASLDDAFQDVFLVVHRRLGEFEPRSSVKAWLFAIVCRVARDHRRLFRRKGGHEELPAGVLDRAPGPAERLEKVEALQLVDALLAELDDDKRAVFVMAEIEELSAPEIAAALDLKLNTVYSRLRAARREFELALARRGGGRP